MKSFIFFLLMAVAAPLLSADPFLVSDAVDGRVYFDRASKRPSLSGDGRYLVFQSEAPLDAGDEGKNWDIYLYDRKEDSLRLLFPSVGPRAFGGARISADGKRVVFYSYPVHVLMGQKPRVAEIFEYDLASGRLENLTPFNGGVFHDGENLSPDLDARGDKIVFTSNATRMDGTETPGFRNVYLFDRSSNGIRLLSRNHKGEPGDRWSLEPRVDPSGKFIGFLSAATNFSPPLDKKNLTPHLYLFEALENRLERVDVKQNKFPEPPGRVGRFSMSYRARHIAFEWLYGAEATQNGLFQADLFLFDRQKKKIFDLTPPDLKGRCALPEVSGDGRYVSFLVLPETDKPETAGVAIFDRRSGRWEIIFSGKAMNPTLSLNGRFVAFQAIPADGEGDPDDWEWQVYLLENPLVR